MSRSDVIGGYWSNLREVIDASPVEVYSASYLVNPYPFQLQHVNEAKRSARQRAEKYILDSHIGDSSITTEEVLEKALWFNDAPDYVVPKDILHDPAETTENVVEFLEQWEDLYLTGELDSTPLLPLQPTAEMRDDSLRVNPDHARHYRELQKACSYWIEEYNLDYYVIGGVAQSPGEVQLESVRRMRRAARPGDRLHGLGMGSSLPVLLELRENPGLLESLDNSSAGQNIMNARIFGHQLSTEEFYYLRGKHASSINGGFEFLQVVQINHLLSDYCRDDILEIEPTDGGEGSMEVVVEQLIERGLSPAQALDVYYTRYNGHSTGEWANIRGVTPAAISNNVTNASEELTTAKSRGAAVATDGSGGGEVLGLMNCGKTKLEESRERAVPARQLYSGAFTRKKRDVLEEISDRYWIISAEHGLLEPEECVEWYDTTVTDPAHPTEAWGEALREQLRGIDAFFEPGNRVVTLVSKPYLAEFSGLLEEPPVHHSDPLAATTGQGDQNGLLKRWLRALESGGR